jgi:2-keto-3-deoxy-L-rhamnonate aldolase RhmA
MAKENDFLKVGGITWALHGVAGLTYNDFVEMYKGMPQLTDGLDKIWKTLKAECKARGIVWKEEELAEAPANTDLQVKPKKKKKSDK